MKTNIKRAVAVICAVMMLIPFALTAFASYEAPFDNSFYYEEGAYTLHYRVFEAENEKAKVLMIHGFGCSTSTWQPIADELVGDGYTCVLVDLPGFGYSTRETEVADEDYRVREELVINLMKSIAPVDTWHVAGHSMGGGVAMNIACLAPEIQSLMLFCPCPIASMEGVMADMMSSKVMGAMANFIFEHLTKVTPLLRLVALMAFMDVEFTMDYDLSLFSAPLQIHNTGYSNMITSAKAMPNDFEKIAKLEMPVLLVQADKDLVLTGAMKTQVDEAFPNAEKYTVAGGGHLCIENHDEELAEIIKGFTG
ncbi:MAG: alpha/beta hydrolase [Clostridia bacterium]|nr:alpha/beta hydrolase [Clostridia bacterium]